MEKQFWFVDTQKKKREKNVICVQYKATNQATNERKKKLQFFICTYFMFIESHWPNTKRIIKLHKSFT